MEFIGIGLAAGLLCGSAFQAAWYDLLFFGLRSQQGAQSLGRRPAADDAARARRDVGAASSRGTRHQTWEDP